MDYLFQVGANRLQGKSGGDSFTDIDMKSVMVSTVTSMTGVGLGNVVSKGIALSRVTQAGTKFPEQLFMAAYIMGIGMLVLLLIYDIISSFLRKLFR